VTVRNELEWIIKTGKFDLHLHTTASDGTFSPSEVVKEAERKGLQAIAITDHDTLSGISEAKETASSLSVIPGIELSTTFSHHGHEVGIDVLGYGISSTPAFERTLAFLSSERKNRAIAIIDAFCSLGMPLTLEDVQAFSSDGVIARPHIAKALVKKGYVHSTQEAFHLYLADGKSCSIPKKTLSVEEGVSLIREAGGIAVLAHPVFIPKDLFPFLLHTHSFDGIEVWHREHSKKMALRFFELARQHHLLPTGGSDFHALPQEIGSFGFQPLFLK
jgi:3',5'-nucleoside bisphosphate phosphatase